jgi:hypothetical protein
MSQSEVLLLVLGVYLLLGMAVIALRWRYGLLRLMAEAMASQYGVPRDKVAMATVLYVLIWPFFVKGFFTDRIYIRRAIAMYASSPLKCDCGGTLAMDEASVRRILAAGRFTVKCEACGKTKTSPLEANIRWTEE